MEYHLYDGSNNYYGAVPLEKPPLVGDIIEGGFEVSETWEEGKTLTVIPPQNAVVQTKPTKLSS